MQAVAIEDADRNTDEHEIISAAQKGDTEAIEYLLKKYKRIVLACVRYYFLPGAEKEDLIQEGMIALYYAIKGFNYQHPFPVFAKTCVARKMCTALRLHTSKKHKPLNDAFYLHKPVYEDEKKTFIDQVPVENKDPCDLVDDSERILKVINFILGHEKGVTVKSVLSVGGQFILDIGRYLFTDYEGENEESKDLITLIDKQTKRKTGFKVSTVKQSLLSEIIFQLREWEKNIRTNKEKL